MTYKEKLQQEHPEKFTEDGEALGCPDDYGYKDKRFCTPDDNCSDCWNREMPEDEPVKDMVNHPSHYADSCSMECIDVMEMIFGKRAVCLYALINAFKYAWRCKHKNGLEDVKKARWYLDYANNGLDSSYYNVYRKLKDLVEKLGAELDADQSKV